MKQRKGLEYRISFDEKVIDYLEKLPLLTRKRIFEKIISTKHNPFRYFKKLVDRPEFSLRVGDYRVLADIDKNEIRIFILLIGHRKNVY